MSLHLHWPSYYSGFDMEVLTDPQGRFEMKAVPPAGDDFTHRLSVAVAGYGPIKYRPISPEGAPGTVVDIGATELLPTDASVSGIALDFKGTPAEGVLVSVFSNSPDMDQPRRNTVTNEKGGVHHHGSVQGSSPAGRPIRKAGPACKAL